MKVVLADPIGAMVAYLKGHTLVCDTGRCQYVTSPLLTKQALPVDRQLPPAIALASAGLGSGEGHGAQAPYASERVDVLAYGKTDFLARRLALLARKALLTTHAHKVEYTHDGILYRTRFISIEQTGGPLPCATKRLTGRPF